VSVILDAGALVAVERRDRRVGAMLRIAQVEGLRVRTSAAAVAQVWRGGARQAHLARVLAGVAAVGLDLAAGKHVGILLGASGTNDVVDAHVAMLVGDGDQVLTSDSEDLRQLLGARAVQARLIRV